MRILAIDTALAACSVAVWSDGRTLSAERRPMPRGQAEAVVPMVEAAMAAAGLTYAALDRIAVTVGPGSFTGIRVGLAAARGIALAAGKPLIGITTLEAMAAAARGAPVLAAIDARRGEVYALAFDAAGEPQGPPAALTIAAASRLAGAGGIAVGIALGNGAPLLQLPPGWQVLDVTLPDPAMVAGLAFARAIPERPPAPLYLRAADATPAKPPP